MFALESLSLVGETYETSQSSRRACDFLVGKQRADGGWGESYKVCHSSRTLFRRELSLGADLRSLCMGRARKHTGRPDVLGSDGTHVRKVPTHGADQKGCDVGHVAPAASSLFWFHFWFQPYNVFFPQDGSWAQEAIEGIFNRTCAISYPNFKFSFTIWMLGKAHKYLEERDALPLKCG